MAGADSIYLNGALLKAAVNEIAWEYMHNIPLIFYLTPQDLHVASAGEMIDGFNWI